MTRQHKHKTEDKNNNDTKNMPKSKMKQTFFWALDRPFALSCPLDESLNQRAERHICMHEKPMVVDALVQSFSDPHFQVHKSLHVSNGIAESQSETDLKFKPE